MNHARAMCIIQGEEKLSRKALHDGTWNLKLMEQRAETRKVLSHGFHHQTYMAPIRSNVRERINQMGDISRSRMFRIGVA